MSLTLHKQGRYYPNNLLVLSDLHPQRARPSMKVVGK